MDNRRDTRDPRGVFNTRESFQDYARFQHGRYRKADPERQRALTRAVERLASSPDDQQEVMAVIAQLTHQGHEVRPDDVPALVAAVQEGRDPMPALSATTMRRAERRRPIPSTEMEQAEFAMQERPRARPERPRFVTRAEGVEEEILAADLATEQEKDLRYMQRVTEPEQGKARQNRYYSENVASVGVGADCTVT
jgi:hypothetical protein